MNLQKRGIMPDLIMEYGADRSALERLYPFSGSSSRRKRFALFYQDWRNRLENHWSNELGPEEKADWVLLDNLLNSELKTIRQAEVKACEMAWALPFLDKLDAVLDAQRNMEDLNWSSMATKFNDILVEVVNIRSAAKANHELYKRHVANGASKTIDNLLHALKQWNEFHSGYDPLYNWWMEKPYAGLVEALSEYAGVLRRDLALAEDPDTIIGYPIGREALLEELASAFVVYTPEELVKIAQLEMDWCKSEMLRASRDLGHGDDWHSAMERVKSLHVQPGGQPALVRDLALEAIAYLDERDLVTIPPLARECWRMAMMTPERQKVNPFFLGGEQIVVSYPTNAMDHEKKVMSMRGNNRHFSRATVQHELIPGHHLQMYSQQRHRPYRQIFYTPFWVEGWTLYWELLLWELGFPQSPEDRIGMLFWRMHRCARVLFSLGFHLGQMTPQECVEMLVNDVGHERENALGEVRRSFGGDYDALYQCAYLIGGLQVRALRRELVDEGVMTNRQFHDGFLKENCMPIAVLRALMRNEPIMKDFPRDWRFYPGV